MHILLIKSLLRPLKKMMIVIFWLEFFTCTAIKTYNICHRKHKRTACAASQHCYQNGLHWKLSTYWAYYQLLNRELVFQFSPLEYHKLPPRIFKKVCKKRFYIKKHLILIHTDRCTKIKISISVHYSMHVLFIQNTYTDVSKFFVPYVALNQFYWDREYLGNKIIAIRLSFPFRFL